MDKHIEELLRQAWESGASTDIDQMLGSSINKWADDCIESMEDSVALVIAEIEAAAVERALRDCTIYEEEDGNRTVDYDELVDWVCDRRWEGEK